MSAPRLDDATAARLAETALAALAQRWPYKLDHLMLDEHDRPRPADVHPVFDGCYDWHSSVHMHWSLLRLLRGRPALPQRGAIVARFASRLTAAAVGVETAYASAPGRAGFERPYGGAWLLVLQSELDAAADALPAARQWGDALRPLTRLFADRLRAWFAAGGPPVRHGLHANTAFAMLLCRRHAVAAGDSAFVQVIDDAARAAFGDDRRYPADYEPGGTDFLSGGLCEAMLMQQVLPPDDFGAWWAGFRPNDAALARWREPVAVHDRLDAQRVHLDGLNLSRAWCLAALAPALPGEDAAAFRAAARAHLAAAWPHVTGGDFVATHWLVSFALLALESLGPDACP